MPWLVRFSGLSASLRTKGSLVDSQSGHMPGLCPGTQWGTRVRQLHITVSLPFSPSLPLYIKPSEERKTWMCEDTLINFPHPPHALNQGLGA